MPVTRLHRDVPPTAPATAADVADTPDVAGALADLSTAAGPGGDVAVRLRLRNAAFGYLGRYATSAQNLRRVLARKARRIDGLDAASAAGIIDEVVAFCIASGLVDDAAFAAMKVSSGLRQGLSRARMAAILSAKGVPATLARESLPAGDDLSGALRLARRRRLGPWRTRPAENAVLRDAAALARAGYPPSLARRVAAMTAEAAEEALAGAA